MKRIVVSRAIFEDAYADLAARYEVLGNQADDLSAIPALMSRLEEAEGLIVTGGEKVTAEMIRAATQLRVISTVSVGYNHIDVAAATTKGVAVCNTPDVLTESTADFAFGLLIGAARRMSEGDRWLRTGRWDRWAIDQYLGADIHHSRLGIVGMGRIGQAIAKRALGFSMTVQYHNRSRLSPEIESALQATYLPFNDLLSTSDHVMLVLPYSAQSHHLIDEAALNRMKRGATLVNIARGGLIDELALARAVRSGHLAAIGLDVFENEPAVRPELLGLGPALLTPHLGSASLATRRAMVTLAVKNLDAALRGERPVHQVNP